MNSTEQHTTGIDITPTPPPAGSDRAWFARCSCDWRGELQAYLVEAQADAEEHAAVVAE